MVKVAVGFGLGLAWLSMSFVAVAGDDAMAKTLFDRGIEARDRGDFAAGCPDLGESYRLSPRPGTLFQWAKCESMAGNIASADTHFHQFVTAVRALSPDKQTPYETWVAEAEQARQGFAEDIPMLTLVLPPSAPTNLVIVRDGTTLTSRATGVEVPVDPGEHVVTTQVPDGPVQEQRFRIERKEKKRLELEVELPKPKPMVVTNPVAVVPEKPTNALRTAGGIVLGVGVTGLLTWGVSGSIALKDMSTVKEVCPKDPCASPADTTMARDAWNRGTAAGNVASVMLPVGLVGVVAGVSMMLAGTRDEKGVAGKTAWVIDVGPTGASLGVKGGWR